MSLHRIGSIPAAGIRSIPFMLFGIWMLSGAVFAQPEIPPDIVRLMNLGKAHLENREAQKAVESYDQAVRLNEQSAPAQRNLARAYLLAQKPADALGPLSRSMRLEPNSPASSYLTGLSHIHLSQFEQAIPHLEQAVRLDPNTAVLRYQLAGMYQTTQQHEKAKKQLLETVRLDPMHASTHFKLGAYARREGDRAEFQLRTREFLRLRKIFPDHTRSTRTLQQCIYTLPEIVSMREVHRRTKPEPALDVKFTDVTKKSFTDEKDRSAIAAAVIDVDEQGRYTLFVTGSNGKFAFLHMTPQGMFRRESIEVRLEGEPVLHHVLVGNFHDDVPAGEKYDHNIHALNDVLIYGPDGVRLLKRTGLKTFRDVTVEAGLDHINAHHVQWVDYEHDGDLDILFARSSGLQLWQNNGDATFENVTERVGLGKTGPAFYIKPFDLDANVAVDLMVARTKAPTLVYENQRAGRFAPMPEPPGPWPVAEFLLADDLNQDGQPDVVLFADQQAVILLGQSTERLRLDLSGIDLSTVVLVDYDNDARLDICAVGSKRGEPDAGAIRLWRGTPVHNITADRWLDVTEKTGLAYLSLPPVKDVVAADFDSDGDTDFLLVCGDNRLRILRNDGGHANGQLKMRLTTIKTNPAGFGTSIELRDRYFFTARTVAQVPIEIGLRGIQQCDSIQTIWTNGVVDNLINHNFTDKLVTVVEKNVATGSCPFLYAWDGKRFRFVTDILGNAPIGLPLTRDIMLPADPDEIVLLGDAESFPPLGEHYTVKVTSEFLEVLYLDSVRLLVIDHPDNIEIHPTDKLMPAPFPVSELWALRPSKPLISATGDDGIDRTDAVRSIDGDFAPPGPLLPPPFRGMCHPLTLTLDFGFLDVSRPLVLALTGWLNYGQASTNIALSQSRAHTVIPPRLEVETTDGTWRPVDAVVGMPAGKTKTILCDLSGKLPPGAKRLRLINTFEIRWDRIRLMERVELPKEILYELSPVSADLQWRGFSPIQSRAAGHPETPDFDIVSDHPPWRGVLEGWCTRYGDVLELVRKRDGQLAVINAGDVMTLGFQAADLPSIPKGLHRTFFFYTYGWEKDGDHNVTSGDTVGPLPTEFSKASLFEDIDENDWRIRYNTRWVPHDQFAPNSN